MPDTTVEEARPPQESRPEVEGLVNERRKATQTNMENKKNVDNKLVEIKHKNRERANL